MSTSPRPVVGAETPSKPRRVNSSDPAFSTFFTLAVIVSSLIVPVAIGIVTWALGWGVLIVLGAAFVSVVFILMVRTWIIDWRAARKDESQW